jgi:hypothetical protein
MQLRIFCLPICCLEGVELLHVREQTQTDDGSEQGTEENIWTQAEYVTGGWRKLHNGEPNDLYS